MIFQKKAVVIYKAWFFTSQVLPCQYHPQKTTGDGEEHNPNRKQANTQSETQAVGR